MLFYVKMAFYKKINKSAVISVHKSITQVLFHVRNAMLCYAAEVLRAYLPFFHMAYGLKFNKINRFFTASLRKFSSGTSTCVIIYKFIYFYCMCQWRIQNHLLDNWMNEWVLQFYILYRFFTEFMCSRKAGYKPIPLLSSNLA